MTKNAVQHRIWTFYEAIKHGYIDKVMDWPYSTFRDHVQRGLYPENRGVGDIDIRVGEPG